MGEEEKGEEEEEKGWRERRKGVRSSLKESKGKREKSGELKGRGRSIHGRNKEDGYVLGYVRLQASWLRAIFCYEKVIAALQGGSTLLTCTGGVDIHRIDVYQRGEGRKDGRLHYYARRKGRKQLRKEEGNRRERC